MSMNRLQAAIPPPAIARRGDDVRTVHADSVADPYEWLRDTDDPEVRAHLAAENDYAEQVCAHLAPLRAAIVGEIGARTQQTDVSVPVYYRSWWYFTRTQQGQQYPISCRVPDAGGLRPVIAAAAEQVLPGEQVLIDGNVEAGQGQFFSLGASSVSSDGRRIALAVDRSGDERFEVIVRDIADGRTLDDALRGVGYGLVWSCDDRFLFYVRVDDAWRSFQVWRHEVGIDPAQDQLVFEEADERFWVSIGESCDDRYLVISSSAKNSSEVWLLDLSDPEGQVRCVAARRPGLEYDVEPAGDVLFIVHNAGRVDFEVAWAPIDATHEQAWVRWFEPQDGERIVAVTPFAHDVAVQVRAQGFTQVRVAPRCGTRSQQAAPQGQQLWLPGAWRGPLWQVPMPEQVHTISLGDNPDPDWPAILLHYESLVTPPTVIECDLRTREQRVLRTQPVRGYEPSDYVSGTLWAQAPDGVRVPMSYVARADVTPDGSAPGVLYAYGAYEVSLDPWFSVARLSQLDRGVVWVIAHARGGGELGRSWYEQGRLGAKATTFTDVLACAQHLIDSGWVAPGRLALEGGSAGGLTVGATINLAPDMFAVAHADVPFVDALNTVLDPAMPLTVTEWDEWGDPLHDPAAYALMKSYTPYENIGSGRYPAILATTSLNDTRVSVVEPAKWVARLRAQTEPVAQAPIVLRTQMVAGHGGRSGRYDAWEQYAWEESFVLWQLGASELLPGVWRPARE